jgi:hypothetical protein
VATFDDEYVATRRRLTALHVVYRLPKALLARECGVDCGTIGRVLAGRWPHMGLEIMQRVQDGTGRLLREREQLLQSVTGGRPI